ncbi:MAG: cobalamin B12-binding domain-containing protein [Thermoleophilaceae bacterium]
MDRSRNQFRKRMLAESLSDQFGLALLAGDSAGAEQVARDALEVTLGETMLYDLVVGPAMHRIGELWAAGEIGVGQEHLATQIATQVLALDMAAKLLESAGYEVLTLGADVPTCRRTRCRPSSRIMIRPCSYSPRRCPRRASACRPAVDAVTAAGGDIALILGGVSIPRSLVVGPRVVVEPRVAGVVEAADGLVRRAGLN